MPIVLDGTAGITYPAGSVGTVASLGDTQTWQTLTASRNGGTTYTNTTGKPIFILVTGVFTAGTGVVAISVDGVTAGQSQYVNNGGWVVVANTIVPPNSTYIVTFTASTKNTWFELR